MQSKKEEHIEGGEKIRSILLGLNDGLISTFTLLVGVAAATIATGNAIVILNGLAEMFSAAISMGLGEYISSKSEAKYIKNEIKREKSEIELFPDEEKEEVRELLGDIGLKGKSLDEAVENITSDKETWLNFLVKDELGFSEESYSPALGGLLTFLAFLLGAFIPLFPYFLDLGFVSLIISSVLSFSMLFIVGALKRFITGENWLCSGLEMVLIGTIAFIISFEIGLALEHLVAG